MNTQFVYKPGLPEAGSARLPLKVAVLAFQDGTEDFTRRGSVLVASGYINFAKAGYSGMMTALPPPLWAKFLAEDMAASGVFRSVRFAFDASEVGGDEIAISGTVLKAYFPFDGEDPSLLAVRLEARVGRGGEAFWHKEISREVPFGKGWGVGCGLTPQCSIDNFHGHHRRLLQEIFLEARRDLVAALQRRGGGAKDEPAGKGRASGSVDEIITDIIRGK